jgi:hypothetical protein
MTALEKQGVLHELFEADLAIIISAMNHQSEQRLREF